MRALVLTLCALAVAISACDSVVNGALVEVTSAEDAEARVVALRNETGAPVYFYIGEEDDLALIDLDLSGITSGTPVTPGATVRVPYEDIEFYDPGDTRGWIYWTTGRGEGESLRVALRP